MRMGLLGWIVLGTTTPLQVTGNVYQSDFTIFMRQS
ncbi:MAG: hypothetical protein QOJ06_276 [Pseudonocardiales bacterium]|jgi:hypothetical protein|nr:hypothetical protein [Pseudonocardiales bacterium]